MKPWVYPQSPENHFVFTSLFGSSVWSHTSSYFNNLMFIMQNNYCDSIKNWPLNVVYVFCFIVHLDKYYMYTSQFLYIYIDKYWCCFCFSDWRDLRRLLITVKILFLNLFYDSVFFRQTKPLTFADCIGDELPVGWEEAYDPVVGAYYVDHNTSEFTVFPTARLFIRLSLLNLLPSLFSIYIIPIPCQVFSRYLSTPNCITFFT